jgi:hypothetical protein
MDVLGLFLRAYGQGPGAFWETDWGSIRASSYIKHIVPTICGWHRLHSNRRHIFMQDNAPTHTAIETTAELETRDITIIKWPSLSLDLNPIETVWN